ncbi:MULTISPECIES: acyl-CoA dehydrogenase [Caulobacter]|jgi:alkylation response protein AidB-like acyl-CoA dehydrogenase|uniref:3-methylmercaptopropionyl-CoA dehydrogenase n=1 Tax=Caulobacter vibrioides OR37 TaxID=1292034 RepID=R0EGL7_CAUVI|nr:MULTISPECIES: acyl-CoA dehydrogenase [Caulobacter]ENZ80422.1 acyl-CoA dehydrogenase [Caulobacter vibrioides OR37]MBQ1562917.1 acyl-CoA dehydrogenase [Caulobacter sp.]
MTYRAPVRDLAFSLRHAAGFDRLADAFPEADADTVAAVLEAAGAFASDVLAPLNRQGDLVGAKLENGVVRCAPGFADAYQRFAQGGWTSLAAPTEHGGQGLPKTLEVAVLEMVQAANMAFGLCPMLSLGAIEALEHHGSESQKATYLPRLVSGEWTGTMNLTEPQAGSDLAALTTIATPDGDGGWKISGQKIYITWGDHDAADNIVHLVLARTPDAPPGVKGISLFLAPKVLVNADGSLGERNALRVGGLEHKLGIHGSPTCVMLFEGAKAELVGGLGQGLPNMFTMMNAARLQVGTQGVAIAERAYQQALAFSQDRAQGRSAWTGAYPSRLFDHPDVRRSLVLMKAHIEAARGICLSTAVAADLARAATDDAARTAAKLREELLTPIAKAWSTDVGVWAASQGVQIHGGMGFIEETGAAQHYRDARIAPIYEGTNGIQAIDLIGRKLSMGEGQAVADLMDDIRDTIDALNASDLKAVGLRLSAALDAAASATAWLIERRAKSMPDALSGATAYLKLLGDVVGGWMLAKGALAASGEADAAWAESKRALARVFAESVLAQVPGAAAGVMIGGADFEAMTPDVLGA